MTFDAQILYWPPLSKLFETLVHIASDDQTDGKVLGKFWSPLSKFVFDRWHVLHHAIVKLPYKESFYLS